MLSNSLCTDISKSLYGHYFENQKGSETSYVVKKKFRVKVAIFTDFGSYLTMPTNVGHWKKENFGWSNISETSVQKQTSIPPHLKLSSKCLNVLYYHIILNHNRIRHFGKTFNYEGSRKLLSWLICFGPDYPLRVAISHRLVKIRKVFMWYCPTFVILSYTIQDNIFIPTKFFLGDWWQISKLYILGKPIQ